MKIVHISTSDSGGAGTACVRLSEGLSKLGVDSKVLVYLRERDGGGVVRYKDDLRASSIGRGLDYLKFGFWEGINRARIAWRKANEELFTSPRSLLRPEKESLVKEADIVHLHWTAYFVDYKKFFSETRKPFVWTLHDMNPFTGGCHHSRECLGYREDCSKCPALKRIGGYARENFKFKMEALENVENMTIVSPSEWMSERAKNSVLFSRFEHRTIRNGHDEKDFKLMDKESARAKLGLPRDKFLILFVSDWIERKAKGFEFLNEAFQKIKKKTNAALALAGRTNLEFSDPDVRTLGFVSGEKLNLAYAAADCLALPSLEDNLPNVAVEAFYCGLPVAGFPVGGIPEMIKSGENGFVCEEKSGEALAKALEKVAERKEKFDRDKIRRKAAEEYGLEGRAKEYKALYAEILEKIKERR